MNPSPDPGLQHASYDANCDPFQPSQARFFMRVLILTVCAIVLFVVFATNPKTAHAAWEGIAQLIGLQGKPAPASANVLSEHEIENLDQMTPQSQATLLLERSINHYSGANEQIAARVDGWRGKIQLDQKLNSLFTTAINSDDLRVRAAGIEIDLAARDLEKNSATIDRLEPDARGGEKGPRANALWDIGLLGNRGVEPQRAAEILLSSIHDNNVNVRYWAVEGLAYLGSEETINSLLEVLHDDPSPMIRERAACGLAQSGMLSQQQRRSAIPKLLEYAEDAGLDAQTRNWIFQALRDITGKNLPHDPAAWRSWYNNGVQTH